VRFGLELHPEKTRLIEFGRFAVRDRKRRDEGKPRSRHERLGDGSERHQTLTFGGRVELLYYFE